MSTLYSAKVTATGGRHGHIRSEDGLLDMKLALPRELGGKGDATNPETLFAGGYAACFENALLRVSREKGLRFADGDVEVIAEIGLSRNDSGNFVLSATLVVAVTGVDQKTAEDLAESAHKICPYSSYSGQGRGRDHRFGSLSRIGPKQCNKVSARETEICAR